MNKKTVYLNLIMLSMSVSSFASAGDWRTLKRDFSLACLGKTEHSLCYGQTSILSVVRDSCGDLLSSCEKALALPQGQTLESFFSELIDRLNEKRRDSTSTSQVVSDAVTSSEISFSSNVPISETNSVSSGSYQSAIKEFKGVSTVLKTHEDNPNWPAAFFAVAGAIAVPLVARFVHRGLELPWGLQLPWGEITLG